MNNCNFDAYNINASPRFVLRGNKKGGYFWLSIRLFLKGLPSATLAWYKQPPAMRVCIKSYTKKSPIVLQ